MNRAPVCRFRLLPGRRTVPPAESRVRFPTLGRTSETESEGVEPPAGNTVLDAEAPLAYPNEPAEDESAPNTRLECTPSPDSKIPRPPAPRSEEAATTVLK